MTAACLRILISPRLSDACALAYPTSERNSRSRSPFSPTGDFHDRTSKIIMWRVSSIKRSSVYDRLQLILEHANCKQVRFHDLRHTFATLALQNGMDVKTLSAMLGHVSAATTLDIYTHSTSDMQHAAARKIDCGIGKAEIQDEPAPQANAPAIVDFQPYMGKVRKPGTGCISQINDHLFEGRYSPTWIDGKKHARNVYAHTREECEEKLKVLIAEMKAELAELKRQKADSR